MKKTQEKEKEKKLQTEPVKQKQTKYLPENQCKQFALAVFNLVNSKFYKIIQYDPNIKRQDTAESIKNILLQQHLLTRLKQVMQYLNNGTFDDKAKNYYLAYDAVLYVIDICKVLRKSIYAQTTIQFYNICISTMESNYILQDVKYLDYKTSLYCQLARVFQQYEQNSNAMIIVSSGIQKINQLRGYHKYDPPVPQYVTTIINNNIRLLKILLLKYKLICSSINVAQWKKKLQQQFNNDPQGKVMVIVQVFRSKSLKQSNIFQDKKIVWKQQVLQIVYDLYKNDLNIICTWIDQTKTKMQKEVEFKKQGVSTHQIEVEEIKRKRQFEQKMIKHSQLLRASANIPLQYHCEIVMIAFEMRNYKIFQEFSNSAQIRIKNRRLEVPYINDIILNYSQNSHPNIENGYQRIPVDLNQINLKISLNKFRSKAKMPLVEPQVQQKKQSKKDDKKGSKQKEKQQQIQQEKKQIEYTQQELKEIKHKFCYLSIKRSPNEDKAIYDINVVMANQDNGPDKKYQKYKKVGLLINQYPGVQQTTKEIPYLIYKRAQGKIQEEQKKSILIDVKPLFGKNPICRPEYGYKKIQVDLRQVPQEFIRKKTNDYIYITYKNDELFNINQRQINVLIALYQLEQSYGKAQITNVFEQKSIQLQLIYDLSKLANLFNVMKQSLAGVLGEQFYQYKKQFINSVIFYIWKKYLRSQLFQFEYVYEIKLGGQMQDYEFYIYKRIIEKAKQIFIDGLKVFNLVLMQKSDSDVIFICKITIQLCKLLEQRREYNVALSNYQFCLKRIEKQRNQKLQRGFKGQNDLILPWSITANNLKIRQLIKQLKDKYYLQKNYIQKLIRIKKRQQKNIKPLDQDQLQQEQFQILQNTIQNQTIIQYFQKLINKKPNNQLQQLINALHTDILINYFRVQLCRAEMVKNQQLHKKSMTLNKTAAEKGVIKAGFQDKLGRIPKRQVQKMGIMFAPSSMQTKKQLNQLHKTLIEQKKIDAPRPRLEKIQEQLKNDCNKNPYQLCLLYATLALTNQKSAQQLFFLNQALKFIQSAKNQQMQMIKEAETSSLYICHTQWDGMEVVYKGINEIPQLVPKKPILLAKSSNWIKMKIPPFIPLVNQRDIEQRNIKSKIISMSLYGKKSAHGVNVSLNNTQLDNTGIRHQIGDNIRINRLKKNQKYCFAAAAFNSAQEVSGGIGQTGQDIGCYLPLPIELICCYISKVAIQVGKYQIAQKAADLVIEAFCYKTQSLDRYLNFQQHCLFYYSLRQDFLKEVSLIQIKALCDTLVIKARCMKLKFKPDKKGIFIIDQKQNLKILNILFLATKLAPLIPNPPACIGPLILNTIEQHPDMLSPLVQLHLLKLGNSFRDTLISSKLSMKIIELCMAKGELALAKKISFRLIPRNYYLIGKVCMVQEKKQKEVKKGSKQPKQQPKIIQIYIRLLIQSASATPYLQNFLISTSEEFYDAVQFYFEKNKELLQNYLLYTQDNQQVQKMIQEFSMRGQFIEIFKDLGTAVTKLQSLNNTSLYLEFLCKTVRRILETSQKPMPQLLNNLNFTNYQKGVILLLQLKQIEQNIIQNNVDFYPSYVDQLRKLKEQTQKEEYNLPIQLFQKWHVKREEYSKSVNSAIQSMQNTTAYQNNWLSQLHILRANVLLNNLKFPKNNKGQFYFHIYRMNLDQFKKKIAEKSNLQPAAYLLPQKQIEQILNIMKQLARAAIHASAFQGWITLQNIIKLLVNLISFTMLSPFEHRGSKIWIYLTIICFEILKMLQLCKIRGFYSYRNKMQSKIKLIQRAKIKQKLSDDITKDIPTIENIQQQQNLKEQEKSAIPSLQSQITKVFWLFEVKQIDLDLLASIFCYTIYVLHLQSKHNIVISLCRQFCNKTNHKYSLTLLKFLLFSQQILLQQAQRDVDIEKQKLKKRTEEYELMKMKKKIKRQQTFQQPVQKIQFQQQKTEMNKRIQIENQKYQICKRQVKACKNVLDQIERDKNLQEQASKECLKHLEQLAYEQNKMQNDLLQDKLKNQISKNKKKQLEKQYASNRQEIQNLKTKRQTILEIRNLNQSGNLAFASGNNKCQIFWTDALAVILQQIRPIERFRQIFHKKGYFMVKQIGPKQTLLAVNILNKLSYVCFYNNLYKQGESGIMAAQMIFSLFKTSLPHTHSLIKFGEYRLVGFGNKENPFVDPILVSLNQTLFSLERLGWMLIDRGKSLHCLPIISLFQHISIDLLLSPFYSIHSKLMKSIALSDMGLINESFQLLLKVVNQKDLPVRWIRQSLFLKKQKGYYWQSQYTYKNDMPSYDKQNIELIQLIFKLQVNKQFGIKYGHVNYLLFVYSKCMLIYAINYQQIFENSQVNEQRCTFLKRVQQILRNLLNRLGNLEEIYQRYISYISSIFQNNPQRTNKLKDMLTSQFKSNFQQNEIEQLLPNSFLTAPSTLSRNQIQLYIQKLQQSFGSRQFRLSMLCRIRILMSKCNWSMNMLTKCYYIIKWGIINYCKYCNQERMVQKGKEGQDLKIVEDKIGEVKDTKKGGKEEKKQKKGSKDKQPQDQDKKRQEQLEFINEDKKIKNQYKKSKSYPNSFWHLKLYYELIKISFRQNRIKQTNHLIQNAIKQCQHTNQKYIFLLLKSIESRIKFKQGKIQQAINQMQQVKKQMANYHYFDQQYLQLTGDLGQIYLQMGGKKNIQIAYKLFEECLKVIEHIFKDYSYESLPNDLNKNSIGLKKVIDFPLSQQQQQFIRNRKQKNVKKKDQKKKESKKIDKKTKEQPKLQYKVSTLSPIQFYQLSKQNKINYQSVNLNVNEAAPPFNCYFKNLFLWAKILIRKTKAFVQLNFPKYWKYQEVNKQLMMLDQIIGKSFNVPLNLKLQTYYYLALLRKNQFCQKLNKLIEKYQNIPKYKNIPLHLLQNNHLCLLPNYSAFLKNQKYLLEQANKYLKKTLNILIGQALFFQNNLNIEDIFVNLADVCLMMAKYIGSVKPKYIDLHQEFDKIKQEKLQAQKYIQFGINASDCKKQLLYGFAQLAKFNIENVHKLDKDIVNQILQSDYNYKKAYEKGLFNQAKKKTTVTSIDVMLYIVKAWKQSKIMTFSNCHLQSLISKVHRFLNSNHSTYKQKCSLMNLEVAPKKDLTLQYVVPGSITIKGKYSSFEQKYKILYILGQAKRDNIKDVEIQNLQKIPKIDEGVFYSQVLFNNQIQIQSNVLDKLLDRCLKLQSNLNQSQKKSIAQKQRDYKGWQKQLIEIIKIFRKYIAINEKQHNLYQGIIPKVSLQVINILSSMLKNRGISIVNSNFNLIIRYFHAIRYQLI